MKLLIDTAVATLYNDNNFYSTQCLITYGGFYEEYINYYGWKLRYS